jgi:preprotein translocase subunit SecA
MLDTVKTEVTRDLMRVKVQSEEQVEQAAQALEQKAEAISNVVYTAPTEDGGVESTLDENTRRAALGGGLGATALAAAGSLPKVGRNDPCPCGSGKKYKHCHGQLN